PVPVVMVSTLTEKGAEATFKALELGAVDFVAKPKVNVKTELAKYAEDICGKVRAAAAARIRTANPLKPAETVVTLATPRKNHRQIIAIGSSTGGTEAIKELLVGLPVDSPPVVITQHIPKTFSAAFAQRLNGMCELTVLEAKTGMQLKPSHVYLAPGDRHLLVVKKGAIFSCVLNDGPAVNRHKPSVDVMFRSLIECAPKDVHAVMLTGMGSDGAEGMLDLLKAGATTTAQDEASSVVWGMPGSAVKLSAVQSVLPLKKIAGHLIAQYE
ncbi:MAG: chemotaxis-specific protein-glutamate methyltransferase CheB, partial [Cycloclasticus sp.]